MAKTVTRVSMDCGASIDRKDPSASRNRDELVLPFKTVSHGLGRSCPQKSADPRSNPSVTKRRAAP